jgi:ABC-type bacteriocin/lantibiotic exporter with double-glycine peptidase domain
MTAKAGKGAERLAPAADAAAGGRCLAVALAMAAGLGLGCASLRTQAHPKAALAVSFEAQAGPKLCAIACVDMLTRSYGRLLSPAARQGLLDEALATGGVSGTSLKAALEEAGYDVAVFPGRLDHSLPGLYRQLDQGRPVIVMDGAGPRHFCVLVGYDEDKGTIMLLDPAVGDVVMGARVYEASWGQASHFALVATPRAR